MWNRATLCIYDSDMISNSIFKDINTYYNILNYKIGMFYRTSFCMFVSKMWTRATLWTNDSSMIWYSICKAINTYSTILHYKIGMFCYKIFLHVRMQKLNSYKKWTRAKLCISESNMISYSIFKAINTYSTIVNYEIGMFCPNIFLHVHMQNVNSCKILHKWIKHDCIFNI